MGNLTNTATTTVKTTFRKNANVKIIKNVNRNQIANILVLAQALTKPTSNKPIKVKEFKPGSASYILEELMQPDPQTGVSKYFDIAELEAVSGLTLRGNGSPFLQGDRGLGDKYSLCKTYVKGSLVGVHTMGFKPEEENSLPSEKVKNEVSKRRCVSCGTSSNTEVDHKNGFGKADPDNINDFQALCGHCNKTKREKCKSCQIYNKRFDAKDLYYKVSWTEGDGTLLRDSDKPCAGCYWYDIADFKSKL